MNSEHITAAPKNDKESGSAEVPDIQPIGRPAEALDELRLGAPNQDNTPDSNMDQPETTNNDDDDVPELIIDTQDGRLGAVDSTPANIDNEEQHYLKILI